MVGVLLNWPILNEKPWLFAIVLVFSIGLFLLARSRRWTAIAALAIALAWILYFEPDLQYYLDIRHAATDSIIEPLLREYYIRGYILAFMPLPFVMLGLWLRRRTRA